MTTYQSLFRSRRVGQGGVLSPFLLNLVIDWVPNNANGNTNFDKQLDARIVDLKYSDNVFFVVDNREDAQTLR